MRYPKLLSIFLLLFFLPLLAQGDSGVTQLNFITAPQTIAPGAVSEKLTIQAQDGQGQSQTIGETVHLKLTSNSATGQFSSSADNWQAVDTLTMNSNWANRSFYYKDSSSGTFTLTVQAEDKNWASAIQTIVIGAALIDSNSSSSTEESATSTELLGDTSNETTSSNNASGGGGGGNISVHASQTELSSVIKKIAKVGAGRSRWSAIGSPVSFTAYLSDETFLPGTKFTWSFGDGSSAEGFKVTHSFSFAGKYNVVLNAFYPNGGEAVSRTVVTIEDPQVALSAFDKKAGYVEITNQSSGELNLGLWSLTSSTTNYILPTDTIISPDSTLKIPLTFLNLPDNITTLSLVRPDQIVVSRFTLPEPISSVSVVSVSQAKTLAELQNKLSLLKRELSVLAAKESDKEIFAKTVEDQTVATLNPVNSLASLSVGADGLILNHLLSSSSTTTSASSSKLILLDKNESPLSRMMALFKNLFR